MAADVAVLQAEILQRLRPVREQVLRRSTNDVWEYLDRAAAAIEKEKWREAQQQAQIVSNVIKSDDVLQVEQGSLYPALHRLIKRGWISVEDGTSENNRRAKFYRLTAKGRRQLAIETSKWDKLAGAIARILRPAEQESKQ